MARPIVFQFGDRSLAFQMNKIDRSRLYGTKETEAVDSAGHPCSLATLAEDGRTLIGRGAAALGWIDADGNWCNKSELTPVDVEGVELASVPSSFSAPVKLFETVSVGDYLSHNIRLVYEVVCDSDCDDLRAELSKGTIFAFPYSYRGGLEADSGFLLTNEGGEMIFAVGNPTRVNFVGLAAPAFEEQEIEPEEGDLMDFDMI